MSVYDKIVDILKCAESNTEYHKKGILMLKAIFIEMDYETCAGVLKKCILAYLKIDLQTENLYVKRLIKFVTDACRALQELQKSIDTTVDAPFAQALLNFLVEMCVAVDDTIRCRSCQFLSKLCTGLILKDFTSTLRDDVHDALMGATQDKLYQIRCYAVIGLAPFQRKGTHCAVADTIAELMVYDPASLVRKACVENLALKNCYINKIVKASADTNVGVRKLIYEKAFMVLPVSLKQSLIFNVLHGETDFAQTILKLLSEELCIKWLNNTNFNYIKFLQLFRTNSNWAELLITQEIQETLLFSLFKLRPCQEIASVLRLDTSLLLKLEDLNWDTSLYWRVLITYLLKLKQSWADTFIPQIAIFRNLVERYCVYMCTKFINVPTDRFIYLEFQFVLVQLFKIIAILTYPDVVTKSNIIELVKFILTTCYLDWETLVQIMAALQVVMPNHLDRNKFVGALAAAGLTNLTTKRAPLGIAQGNELLDSVLRQPNVAQSKISIYILYDDLEQAIKIKDYIKADEIQQRLKEPQFKLYGRSILSNYDINTAEKSGNMEKPNNSFAIVHWLNVVSSLYYNRIDSIHTTLPSIMSKILDRYIEDDDPHIQIAVMRCLAFYCSMNINNAKIIIPYFCRHIIRHTGNVQCRGNVNLIFILLSGVIDAIMKYGCDAIFPKSITNMSGSILDEDADVYSSSVTFKNVMDALLVFLNAESTKVQELIGRGLCNFLLKKITKSHEIITALILKYITFKSIGFNEIKLQQYIGLTLRKLPFIPDIANQFETSVMESIVQVLKLSKDKKFKNPKIDSMIKFLLNLCFSFSESDKIIFNLSLKILEAINTAPNDRQNAILCKMLTMLKFSEANLDYLDDLCIIIDRAKHLLKEKKSLEYVLKFSTYITRIRKRNETEEIKNRGSEEHSADTYISQKKRKKLKHHISYRNLL